MQFDQVLEILKHEGAKRRKRNKILWGVMICLVGLQAAGLGYMISTGKESLAGMITSLAPLICLLGASVGLSSQAKTALISSAGSHDPRLVGHLIEALTSGDEEVIKLARETLVQIMPRLTEEAPPLDKIQHQALIQAFTTADQNFIEQSVRALRVIGRPESIGILESLASGKGFASVPKVTPKLQTLAQESIGLLRLRLAKAIIQRRISEVDELRPLDNPQEVLPEEVLLRNQLS